MEIDKATPTSSSAIREHASFILNSLAMQKDFINLTSSQDAFKTYTKILKRAKRETAQLERYERKWLCKNGNNISTALSMFDGLPFVSFITGALKGFIGGGQLALGCDDIPFEEMKEVLGDGFSKVGDQLRDVSKGIQGLSKDVAKNYFAILKNYDAILENRGILLSNRALLMASQGLMLLNTGLLVGIAFMVMGISSKLDRNYEVLKQIEAKVDRNFEAIRIVESKVDRNLKVMLSSFRVLEQKLERGFREITDFLRQINIEEQTSELITFIKYFIKVKHDVESFTREQYTRHRSELTEILDRLQSARLPQTGTLHTILYNMINQRFAVPKNAQDSVAFTALGLLCSGTEVYVAVMVLLFEEYSNLAKLHYEKNDLEKYNYYISMGITIYNDFRNLLTAKNGLIDEVASILKEIMSYDFITDEREDVSEFARIKIADLLSLKLKVSSMYNLSREKSNEKIKFDFSHSHTKTPIGNWEDRRKVSYAIQFQSNATTYEVGQWSTSARVYKKANPLLDIGSDSKGRTRLLFRKFDDSVPELVGIIQDSKQTQFRDINRDLYNSALEPNEEVAITEMKTFLSNGADVHARFEDGRQAIHSAAENGNTNVAYVLIDAGADVNAKDSRGYHPIHIAALEGHEEFVKYLVYIGADVNAETNLGVTALQLASQRGYVNTVKNLMTIKDVKMNAVDERGFTSLHNAVSFEKYDVITILSQDRRTDLNKQSKLGFTSLHLAVIGEYVDAIETLLDNSEVDVNAKSQNGLAPLHFAALIGKLDVAQPILSHTKLEFNPKTNDGWTPLHLAIISKHDTLALEFLSIENFDINSKGKEELTPLHLAASTEQKNILIELLNKDADLEAVDMYGCTPLHFAVESGNLDVVDYLVTKGADMYAERKDGYTPTGLAATNGKLDIIQYFVDDKKIGIDAKNKNGMTLIDFAAKNGHFDAVEYLLDKKSNKEYALHWASYGGNLKIIQHLANEKDISFTTRDLFGNIPLHVAALQGHLHVVRYFIDEQKVWLDAGNNDGYTPFLFAVLGNHLDMVKYFTDEKKVNLKTCDCDNSGSTALHLSALYSSLGMLKYLIKMGADLEAEDDYGNTPLFLAASRGHLGIFSYLVQKGSNIEIANSYGNTPLHFAAWNGHTDIVKYIGEKKDVFNIKNRSGSHPVHVSTFVNITRYLIEKGSSPRVIDNDGDTPLHFASLNGNLNIVEYLVQETEADLNSKNVEGNTAVHLAGINGHLDVVRYLIDKNADVIKCRNNNGNTVLHLAVSHDHSSLIDYLVDETEANINVRNKHGNTALHLAVTKGNFDAARHLIDDGSSVNVKNSDNSTVLHLAAFNGHLGVVEYLVQNKSVAIDSEDNFGNTPLLQASVNNMWEVVKYLLNQGADIETGNADGWTLVHSSAYYNNLDMLKLIFGDGYSSSFKILKSAFLNAVDKLHKTPLHVAAERGSVKVIHYLITKGADTNIRNIYDKRPLDVTDNGEGWTPLHCATKEGELETVRLLVNKGSGLFAEDGTVHGKMPIHIAAQEDFKDILEFFIVKGVPADDADKMGWTPMHHASKHGRLNSIVYLGEQKANFNSQDISRRQTPLLLAAEEGKLKVVEYLLKNGVKYDQRNKEGFSAVHLAAQNGHLDVVKYYKEAFGIRGNLIAAKNNEQVAPLHLAAENGYLDVVKSLAGTGGSVDVADGYKRTPLHLAAREGHLDVVKYLLERAAIIEAKDSNSGYTPLHYASIWGHLSTVKYLIEKNASVNAIADVVDPFSGPSNESPLFSASRTNNLHVVRYLLGKGAVVDALRSVLRSEVPDNDERPINLYTELYTPLKEASELGHLGVVKHLIRKGAYINKFDDPFYRESPLFVALVRGKLKIVHYLVQKGATNSDLSNINYRSPYMKKLSMKLRLNLDLLAAVPKGNLTVVKALVENGASLYAKDKDGHGLLDLAAHNSELVSYLKNSNKRNTAMLKAVEHGSLMDVINFISEGVSMEAKTINEETPFFAAVNFKKMGIINHLVAEKADLNMTDMYNWTPLHLAAYRGEADVIKCLVKNGADLEAKSDDGNTPFNLTTSFKVKKQLEQAQLNVNLIGAVNEGNLESVKKYADQGASIDIKDFNGNTLLDLAAKKTNIELFLQNRHQVNVNLMSAAKQGNLDAVKGNLSAGASFEAKNEKGETPIIVAASSGKMDVVRYLADKGADVDVINRDDITLHLVDQYGGLDDVKYIAVKGVDLEVKDKEGNSLLHKAVSRGSLELLTFLVQKGVDVNTRNNKSTSPLHVAVFKANVRVVEFLVENGADLDANNDDGYTPLHIAASIGETDLVKYLVENGSDLEARTNLNKTAVHLAIECRSFDIVAMLQSAQQHSKHQHHEELDVENPLKENSTSADGLEEDMTSSASRSTSWINVLATTIANGILNVSYMLPSPFKSSSRISSRFQTSSDQPNRIKAPHDQYTANFGSELCVHSTANLVLLLLKSFLDKKYPLPQFCSSTPGISKALSIVESFETMLRQTAADFEMSVDHLDFFEIHLNVADQLRKGNSNQLAKVLFTAAKVASNENEEFFRTVNLKIESILSQKFYI